MIRRMCCHKQSTFGDITHCAILALLCWLGHPLFAIQCAAMKEGQCINNPLLSRRIVFLSIWGPGSAPDVPHAVFRVITVGCAEGSGVGVTKEPSVSLSEERVLSSINSDLKAHGKVNVKFLFQIVDGYTNEWEATYYPGCIALHVPEQAAVTGSKSCFIALLEYILDKLKCEVYIDMEKDHPYASDLVRTFFFYGFEIVTPGSASYPASSSSIVMLYTDV